RSSTARTWSTAASLAPAWPWPADRHHAFKISIAPELILRITFLADGTFDNEPVTGPERLLRSLGPLLDGPDDAVVLAEADRTRARHASPATAAPRLSALVAGRRGCDLPMVEIVSSTSIGDLARRCVQRLRTH
ncbi:hypothetical protein, partial [Streptomyces albireticuli]|uniref:hypothetical protein n=1 Tax=Streptomyces albireticuli TaxID=1940 RepID=UPI0036CEDE80